MTWYRAARRQAVHPDFNGTALVRARDGRASMLDDRALSRMAGAPLVAGNCVRLLRDAAENYPAWMEAIRHAKRSIYFETYAVHADETGHAFSRLLTDRARDGIDVRVIYDWFGALGSASFLFWHKLRKAGVQVRCFHPPHPDDPLEWFRRDHRKILVVDDQIGFVSGLCVGDAWIGDAARGIAPWRDTGVVLAGPAVAELSQAFARVWNSLRRGNAMDLRDGHGVQVRAEGNVSVRVVSGVPGIGGLYRLDLVMAALARRSIWLTDAYFFATPAYVQSLRAAALDGIDVRLLVPRTSDIPVVRALSRVGYRSLLEAGVRIFEWNGSMLHAKTAVVDAHWSRIGSTNLNIASWVGNYELDVVVENGEFANAMRRMYLDDLTHATEIVLDDGAKVRLTTPRRTQRRRQASARSSVGRAATGIVAMGTTAGAALARSRPLGPAEAPVLLTVGIVLLTFCGLMATFPRVAAMGAAVCGGWIGITLIVRAVRVHLAAARKPSNATTKQP